MVRSALDGRSRAVVFAVVGLLGAFTAGCGGRSKHPGGSGAAAGDVSEGRAGSSGAAGSSTVAGAGGTGDTVTGGSGGAVALAGGSAGMGGTLVIGAAGALASDELPRCLQPAAPGPCRGALERWAFDPSTLECKTFVYGGCGGNDNRFTTREECEAACVVSLPEGCAPEPSGGRPEQCPCTESTPCDGICNSPSQELGGICRPAAAGYCKPFRGEGDCFCALDGSEGCGV
jgi:hypothetical protein